MQSILDFLSSFVFSITDFFTRQLTYLYNLLLDLSLFISDFIVDSVDAILGGISAAFNVFFIIIQDLVNFFILFIEHYIQYFCDNFSYFFSDFLYDLIVFVLKKCLYYLLILFDSCLNMSVDITSYCILELLPSISLPAGFDVGMRYFLGFGMILNAYFPFAEFVGFFIALISIRILAIAIKFVPYIGGVIR
jgi:hypothetical protein